MGLDLTLGGLILISGIRGWLRGFTLQALRLGGLVAATYVAVPVRNQIKPYALSYLPTIRPDLVDRLLWWVAAAASYFIIVGVGSLVLAISRRQPQGLEEPNRGDQFAGLGLGILKGALVAAFLVAGLQRYASPHFEKVSWAKSQMKESMAWDWNTRFHPADRVWSSPPVQEFVAHVKRMGLNTPEASKSPKVPAEPEAPEPVQTASRTPSLALPPAPDDAPAAQGWGFAALREAVRSLLPDDSP